MSMIGPKMGTFWVHSKSDPRFDNDWQMDWLIAGGVPDEVKEWVENKRKELDLEKLPEDISYGFMKD